MTKKTILGQGAWYLVYGAGERTYIATTFTFDDANQLVSSTVDGVTTRYTYDAAGRLAKEGNKTYRYGYLDKVMSVSDGKQKLTYDYHADGQIASADYGNGKTEEFLWDGLALIRRGGEHFINEPHVGGGNPVVSSKGTSYFNDMLGTTVGAKKDGKYSAAALTAFGERLDNVDSTSPAIRSLGEGWFTGKPYVEGLGRTFLMRNYRASLGKWQTADPIGYPDGWNQLAYCGNEVISSVDFLGCKWVYKNIFYFKKIDFDIPVVIPGGLPISVNPTPPTIVSALVSWIMDQFAQGIAKDVKPNWELIKYFANESGYGNLEPSSEEILNEIINNGYEDWEYVSDGFSGKIINRILWVKVNLFIM